MKWAGITVILLSYLASSASFSVDSHEWEEGLSRIFEQIGEQSVWITAYAISQAPVDPEGKLSLIDRAFDWIPNSNVTSNKSSDCQGCLTFIGLLQGMINEGVTFDEIRDLAVDLCYPVVISEGWRPRIVCEDAIDNFGPHLYYVLNVTDLDAEGICWKWNNCDSEEVDPPGEEPFPINNPDVTAWRAPQWTQDERNIPLEETLKVVHLTDIHVDKDYYTGAATDCHLPVCCHEEWNGTGYAGQWGDYECNIPPRTLELYLNFLYEKNPHFLMYTGDNPPHTTWMETQQGQLNATIYVADAIGRNMPGVPSFPSMGNHETYPTNLYYTARPDIQELNRVYHDVWQPVAGFGAEQEATIMDGGYYSQILTPGLRVLSYNSNYGATENWYNLLNEEGPDYARMRQFMEDTLSFARDNHEKVILLGHHQSGSNGRYKSYNAFINDILARYGDVIILHLQGHSHSDSWKITSNPETGEPYNVQISSPSVTSKTDINPSGRIFYLHPGSFLPIDMDTFYLDLQNAMNEGDDPQIQLTYRASEDYGMTDLSPASFMDLTYRMEDDPELFAKYEANKETKTGFEGSCDDACRHRSLCKMRTTDVYVSQQC